MCIITAFGLNISVGDGPLTSCAQHWHDHTRRQIEGLPSLKGCKAVLRLDDSLPYTTDNGKRIPLALNFFNI